MNNKEIIIVTGLSGAGKTTALNVLEDLGFYTIDNLPLGLEKSLLTIDMKRIAVGMDIRTFKKIEDFCCFISSIKKSKISYRILFIEATDPVILSRYNLSRRNHPLKRNTLLESIIEERELFFPIREISDFIVDTSNIRPRNLEEKIRVNIKGQKDININIQSFGFKYGPPTDSDLLFDVRFISNPYYIEKLREQNGLDIEVKDYIMQHKETQEFYKKFIDFIEFLIPQYIKEGKKHLTISIGCSGGKHRSVAFVDKLKEDLLKKSNLNVYASHREKEIGRW